jgi:hypothetical protein
VFATAAWAQLELKPIGEPPQGPATVYRSYLYLDAEQVRQRAQSREHARNTYWGEEAERIARSGRRVIREGDELYIYLDAPPQPAGAVVLRSLWTIDPAATYLYESFDDRGRFHIVRVGGSDYPTFLFISARTGLIYESTGVGTPVYSPDKTRFFTAGMGGMGSCGEGFTVYRFESDKVFVDAQARIGCEQCVHAWSGSDEIRSDCKILRDGSRAEYRLTYRDGTWHKTGSPEAR